MPVTAARTVKVQNASNGAVLGTRVRVADRMLARLQGFLGHAEPLEGEGLLLRPCHGVHMFGMRYALDVVFLTRDGRIVRTCERLAPGRAVPWVRGAHEALELPAGTVRATATRVGDRVDVSPA